MDISRNILVNELSFLFQGMTLVFASSGPMPSEFLCSIGMDRTTWQPGPRFKGINKIPEGFHVCACCCLIQIFSFVPKHLTQSTRSIIFFSPALIALSWTDDEQVSFLDSADTARLSLTGSSTFLQYSGIHSFHCMYRYVYVHFRNPRS